MLRGLGILEAKEYIATREQIVNQPWTAWV